MWIQKNRRTDETVSNFNIIIIPNGLWKVNNNQSFELNVISFNCVNSFYQCNNNSDNSSLFSETIKYFIYIWYKIIYYKWKSKCICHSN